MKHVHGCEDGAHGLYEAHKANGGGPRGKGLVPTSGGILRKESTYKFDLVIVRTVSTIGMQCSSPRVSELDLVIILSLSFTPPHLQTYNPITLYCLFLFLLFYTHTTGKSYEVGELANFSM